MPSQKRIPSSQGRPHTTVQFAPRRLSSRPNEGHRTNRREHTRKRAVRAKAEQAGARGRPGARPPPGTPPRWTFAAPAATRRPMLRHGGAGLVNDGCFHGQMLPRSGQEQQESRGRRGNLLLARPFSRMTGASATGGPLPSAKSWTPHHLRIRRVEVKQGGDYLTERRWSRRSLRFQRRGFCPRRRLGRPSSFLRTVGTLSHLAPCLVPNSAKIRAPPRSKREDIVVMERVRAGHCMVE